jgi:hypothetical protein
MAGLNLSVGLGGARNGGQPQYGTQASYQSGLGATSAAFAGPSTTSTPTTGQAISPMHGFGLSAWIGIAAIIGLILVRNSLPN